MNPIHTVDHAWPSLEAAHLPADEMRVLEAEGPELPAGKPLFALDRQGQRHLLIPVPTGTEIIEDRESSGVQIHARHMLDRKLRRSYVDVICLKPHLHEVFSIAAGEMLDLLSDSGRQPDQICREVLDRWRELLARDAVQRPSITTITGLFGELWQLRELTQIDQLGLQCWIGPRKARYDFAGGDVALEVKSTLVRHGRFFEVHGHQQLEVPDGGKLYVATLKLEQLPGTGESLWDIVEQIIVAGGNRSALMVMMMHAGITSTDLDSIKDIRFKVLEHRVYEVNDRFPRITRHSFRDGIVPPGVLRITYQIDLANEPPHPLEADDIIAMYQNMIIGVRRDSST